MSELETTAEERAQHAASNLSSGFTCRLLRDFDRETARANNEAQSADTRLTALQQEEARTNDAEKGWKHALSFGMEQRARANDEEARAEEGNKRIERLIVALAEHQSARRAAEARAEAAEAALAAEREACARVAEDWPTHEVDPYQSGVLIAAAIRARTAPPRRAYSQEDLDDALANPPVDGEG